MTIQVDAGVTRPLGGTMWIVIESEIVVQDIEVDATTHASEIEIEVVVAARTGMAVIDRDIATRQVVVAVIHLHRAIDVMKEDGGGAPALHLRERVEVVHHAILLPAVDRLVPESRVLHHEVVAIAEKTVEHLDSTHRQERMRFQSCNSTQIS